MNVRSLCILGATLFSASQAAAQEPADTYFSLAVTENSHNHVGANKLFLDFQQLPFGTPDPVLGRVISAEIAPGQVTLDGDASDWNSALFTVVPGVVQNNYPLSEFIDGVATDISVGSAWDATHVYFVLQWEDAGHTKSTRYKKWIYGDQGAGEAGWNAQTNVGATPGAPNAAAVNATGHVLASAESEDRVFMMFPITDVEGNYTPNGAGCAMYCHSNLQQDFPWQNYTGDGVVKMGTNLPGDSADIWHWKAARTEPSGFADDKWLDFALGTTNGRKSDAGTSAYFDNSLNGSDPTWMHQSGLSFIGNVLQDVQAVLFAGTPLAGDQLPAIVSRPSLGSRADVETFGAYNPTTKLWTLEMRRVRDTGNADDHSFNGAPSAPPVAAIPVPGNVLNGELLYNAHCQVCHFAGGVGLADSSNWAFPNVQRTTGSTIQYAINTSLIMQPLIGVLSEQEMEDVGAYLQTQATFAATYDLTVNVVGATGASLVISDPPGIDCDGVCSVSFTDGTPVTLTAAAPPGYVFAGWSGPCTGIGSCGFALTADTTVTATFAPLGPGSVYCVGDGSGASCPCNNENDASLRGGLSGCANGTSAGGCSLYASGSASVSAADLVLHGEGLPSGQPGLYYQGLDQVAGGQGVTFGDGLRCAGTGVIRLQVLFTDGAGSTSTTIDLVAKGAVSAGDTRRYQLWYRDPNGSLCGAKHNLSNGYELTWTP